MFPEYSIFVENVECNAIQIIPVYQIFVSSWSQNHPPARSQKFPETKAKPFEYMFSLFYNMFTGIVTFA